MKHEGCKQCICCINHTDAYVDKREHCTVHMCLCTVKNKIFNAKSKRICKYYIENPCLYTDPELSVLEEKLKECLYNAGFSKASRKLIMIFYRNWLAPYVTVDNIKTLDVGEIIAIIGKGRILPKKISPFITYIQHIKKVSLGQQIVLRRKRIDKQHAYTCGDDNKQQCEGILDARKHATRAKRKVNYAVYHSCINCKNHADTCLNTIKQRTVHTCLCTIKNKTVNAIALRKCKYYDEIQDIYNDQEMSALEEKLKESIRDIGITETTQKNILGFYRYWLAPYVSIDDIKTLEIKQILDIIGKKRELSKHVSCYLSHIRRIKEVALGRKIVTRNENCFCTKKKRGIRRKYDRTHCYKCIECKNASNFSNDKQYGYICFCGSKQETVDALKTRNCCAFVKNECPYKDPELVALEQHLVEYLGKTEYAKTYINTILSFYRHWFAMRVTLEEIKTLDIDTLYSRVSDKKLPRSVVCNFIGIIQTVACGSYRILYKRRETSARKLEEYVAQAEYDNDTKENIINFYKNVLLRYYRQDALRQFDVKLLYRGISKYTRYDKEWCLDTIRKVKHYLIFGYI